MTTRAKWFDAIGLTYAKNFDEVEAARSAFAQQRQAMLDTLVRAFESAFDGTAFKPFERGKHEGGWETFWLTGQFAKAKMNAGTGPRQTAITFGLDTDACFVTADGGQFGFGAYLLFKMSKRRFEQLRPAITSVRLPFDYYAEDRNAYLRTAWITPDDARFALDAFEEEVTKLPELFAKADEVIGPTYHKLKFGE